MRDEATFAVKVGLARMRWVGINGQAIGGQRFCRRLSQGRDGGERGYPNGTDAEGTTADFMEHKLDG